MDDLARGWAIVWAHMHGHGAVWIGSTIATWVAIWVAASSGRKARNCAEAEDNDLRPKPRTLIPGSEKRIPGSEKDYRR